jgi:hypothetical protein
MAEQEQGGEQTTMQEDYFSTHDLIDSRDGVEETVEEKETQDGEKEEKPKTKEPDKKTDEPEKKDGKKPGEKEPEKKTPQITGFASRFFKSDEKTGESVFDGESAHSFLQGSMEKPYAYQGKHIPPQGEKTPKPEDKKPEVEPWKKPLEERRQYRQNLMNAFLLPVQAAQKQYGDSVPPEIADYQRAQIEHVNQLIDEEMARYDYEQQEKREKENWKKGESAEKQAALKQKAIANESVIAARFKSSEDYQEFMFGKVVNGKHEPGLATHAIYKAFDLANPDKAGLYGAEYDKALKSWWNEFASDQDNLEFLFEIGMARLQKSLWGELVKKVQTTRDKNTADKKKALKRAPGRSEPSPLDEPDLDDDHKTLARQLGRDTI